MSCAALAHDGANLHALEQRAPDLVAFGGDPWSAEVLSSAAFAQDDAFVFADVDRRLHLDPDVIAVAVRADQDRLADAASDALSTAPLVEASGRVGAAFDRFIAVGAGGEAYAARGFARDEATEIDVVDAEPTGASRVALNVGDR